MKRDLYAEVSTRIVAELERGAAPWIKPWSATFSAAQSGHSWQTDVILPHGPAPGDVAGLAA